MLKRGVRQCAVLWAIGLAVVGGMLALGVPRALAADHVVKIGFFAPLTGPVAADGKSSLTSAQLAVEQINKAGGIRNKRIELVVYDDRLDPKEAVGIAQKLINQDRVVAVVSGSYSGPTRATAPVFQEARVPLVAAYAVHPDITKAGNYVFRQSFLGTVQGRAGAVVAVDLLKAKRIAILMMDNDFGRTLSDSFRAAAVKRGAEIVSVDTFPAGEKEFAPILTRLKQTNLDLIYNTGYPSPGSLIIKQARELGLKSLILGTEGIDSTTQFFGIAGAAAEGVIITTNLNRDDKRPVVQTFIREYAARHGQAPDMVGASTYDAVQIVARSIGTAGSTDRKAVRDAIAAVSGFDGVTGVIKGYTPGGEVLKPVQVQIVRGGAFRYFGEVTDPAIITPPQ